MKKWKIAWNSCVIKVNMFLASCKIFYICTYTWRVFLHVLDMSHFATTSTFMTHFKNSRLCFWKEKPKGTFFPLKMFSFNIHLWYMTKKASHPANWICFAFISTFLFLDQFLMFVNMEMKILKNVGNVWQYMCTRDNHY